MEEKIIKPEQEEMLKQQAIDFIILANTQIITRDGGDSYTLAFDLLQEKYVVNFESFLKDTIKQVREDEREKHNYIKSVTHQIYEDPDNDPKINKPPLFIANVEVQDIDMTRMDGAPIVNFEWKLKDSLQTKLKKHD